MDQTWFWDKIKNSWIQLWIILSIHQILWFEKTFGGDVKPKHEKYTPDYSIYHNLSSIQTHLSAIANRNPHYLQIDWSYMSRNGRPQILLHMTNFTDSVSFTASHSTFIIPKTKILLSYGEHAREFLPIESLFYLLHNITSGLTFPPNSHEESFSRKILSSTDLYIVAMANPDGRYYLENAGNYCWRGTSNGVDLNRNFDWHFGGKGSSADKRDEEYRGSSPFSEPETMVWKELSAKYKFDAFVSLHSGIRQIYVPFADSESKRLHRKPFNAGAMIELARKMATASVNKYSYGLAYDLNQYTADGTIFDFMAGVRKVPFSYAIELWGIGDYEGAKCFDLFNPPSHDLKQAVRDIHPLYVTLFDYLLKWKHVQQTRKHDPLRDAPPLSFGYMLLCLVIIVTLCVGLHNRLPSCLKLYPRRRVVSLRSLGSSFSFSSVFKSS